MKIFEISHRKHLGIWRSIDKVRGIAIPLNLTSSRFPDEKFSVEFYTSKFDSRVRSFPVDVHCLTRKNLAQAVWVAHLFLLLKLDCGTHRKNKGTSQFNTPGSSTHQFDTKGPLFSFPKIYQFNTKNQFHTKNVSSTQKTVSLTHPSVQHISSTQKGHFFQPPKFVSSTQKNQFHTKKRQFNTKNRQFITPVSSSQKNQFHTKNVSSTPKTVSSTHLPV